MTPTDTSALRALRDTPKVNFVAALVSAADDLLDELDQLRGQVADAWEALVGNRDGYTTPTCEFGPAGGPYVTAAEPERLTLAQFVERTMPELEAELKAGGVALGQVARVEALHVPNSESWHPGTWCNECMQADHEGLTGCEYPCPTKQALAIPAERTGVSRESIEQVRWAEANPDAVALDEVEAARRDDAEGGE